MSDNQKAFDAFKADVDRGDERDFNDNGPRETVFACINLYIDVLSTESEKLAAVKDLIGYLTTVKEALDAGSLDS